MHKEVFNYQKRIWAIVNLDYLEHNYSLIKKRKTCCVVKANAYGHGSIQIAKTLEKSGASYFAVSNIEEAIQLRNAHIETPILVLGYSPVECVDILFKYKIDQAVFNYEYAQSLNMHCVEKNIKIRIHLKIDTGMGRIGFQFHGSSNELNQALLSCNLSNLIPTGIFTHFAIADEGINDFTSDQFRWFSEACCFLEDNGVSFQIRHCSNSAAIIDYPKYELDMVRAGISLYGINPTKRSIELKPILSLWSVVSNVKTIHKGDSVSYGRTYIAQKEMVVATIPVGYADGFWRSNQGHHVYINGEFCEIIGRVCMDQIIVKCKKAKIGDLVEIYGEHIPVVDVAKYNNTIPYEILCSIGERVPRIYVKNGEIIEIMDKLV